MKSGPAFQKTEHSELIAVMRRNAEKAADYAHRHSVRKWYADADLLINDPEVNAIYVATPPGTHAEYAIKAMHVITSYSIHYTKLYEFTGRFNKGVDYVGDTVQFTKEFEADLMVIDYAVKNFGLPESLKLSVHSGSDKFTIYPIMADLLKKHDKGLHIKTAGTTWLDVITSYSIHYTKLYESISSFTFKYAGSVLL